MNGPVYLDCNATTPLEPTVRDIAMKFLSEEFGNAGSRTHEYGTRAKSAVQSARDAVASLVNAGREDVIFTSGATESNNLAILGLQAFADKSGRKHIVSTAIEHKAVLEPLEELRRRGFQVDLVGVDRSGRVDPIQLASVVRPETLLVSVMHVNNETGVEQPIAEIADQIGQSQAYFHVDAAQGFGKRVEPLRHRRIDLISASGHKLYAPKGIGALIVRKRGYDRPPLNPLIFGGGQERGLRAGTLPVALIAAFGTATDLAQKHHATWGAHCAEIKQAALASLTAAGGIPVGRQDATLPSTLNIRFPGLDSEALMVALKDLIAISNGSACTSQSYTPSHVLKAMGLTDAEANECVRLSWSHLTPRFDWEIVAGRLRALRT